MKILISTDIEGVAGVYHPEQTRAGNPEYERARVLMTHEANAAIAGAFDARRDRGAGQRFARRLSQHAAGPARPARAGRAGQAALPEHDGRRRPAGGGRLHDRLPLARPGPRHPGAHHQQLRVRAHPLQRPGAGRSRHLRRAGRRVRRAGGDGQRRRRVHRGTPAALSRHDASCRPSAPPARPAASACRRTQACSAIRAGVAAALAQPRQGPRPSCCPARSPCASRPRRRPWPTCSASGPPCSALQGDEVGFDAPTVEAAVRMINCLSAMSTMLR